MQTQEGRAERRLILAILTAVRRLVGEALDKVPVGQVDWREMRWDVADVTATWSQDNSDRNIHAWLEGGWPTYTLRFEGAVWQDDEAILERRVRFFSGPTGTVMVRGSFDQPQISISSVDPHVPLQTQVEVLAKEVYGARLDPQVAVAKYELKPPHPSPG